MREAIGSATGAASSSVARASSNVSDPEVWPGRRSPAGKPVWLPLGRAVATKAASVELWRGAASNSAVKASSNARGPEGRPGRLPPGGPAATGASAVEPSRHSMTGGAIPDGGLAASPAACTPLRRKENTGGAGCPLVIRRSAAGSGRFGAACIGLGGSMRAARPAARELSSGCAAVPARPANGELSARGNSCASRPHDLTAATAFKKRAAGRASFPATLRTAKMAAVWLTKSSSPVAPGGAATSGRWSDRPPVAASSQTPEPAQKPPWPGAPPERPRSGPGWRRCR